MIKKASRLPFLERGFGAKLQLEALRDVFCPAARPLGQGRALGAALPASPAARTPGASTEGAPHVAALPEGTGEGQLLAVAAAGLLLLYIALCYQDFHFRVAQAYARLGYPHAQHIVGQRYLQGAGVEKSEALAMRWFRQAAGQGHPHSSFNLVLGALRNMTAALEKGEVEKLLGVAAAHGLQEAQELLENILKSQNLP
nr:uncharacterized protein LOC125183082 isoform X2 [Anser cygnoides]